MTPIQNIREGDRVVHGGKSFEVRSVLDTGTHITLGLWNSTHSARIRRKAGTPIERA